MKALAAFESVFIGVHPWLTTSPLHSRCANPSALAGHQRAAKAERAKLLSCRAGLTKVKVTFVKRDNLSQFALLRAALEKERAKILARLKEIEAVLPGAAVAPAAAPIAVAKAKRKMSAAARARIAAAQRTRWAARKGEGAPKPAPAKPAKRKMSAEGRRNIALAAKARWAKLRAQKAAKAKA